MNDFIKNTFLLSFGNILSQCISLLAIPIITRIYEPSDYGAFAIIVSIVMVLAPVSTLRFNSALMLPESKVDAANLFALSVFSVLVSSSIIFLVLLLHEFFSLKLLPFGMGSSTIFFLPLLILIQGMSATIIFWALRSAAFLGMTYARISESLFDRGVVLLFGYCFNAGVFGLVLGRVMGPLSAAILLFWRFLLADFTTLYKKINLLKIKEVSMRYRKFSSLSSLSYFVDSVSREVPLLMLGAIFSPSMIGFYALGMRVVNLPMKLIGDSISKVFLQRATSDFDKGEDFKKDCMDLFGILIYLSLPAVLVLGFFGEELFGFVFGKHWEESGRCVQILAISFFCFFLYRPLSVIFEALEKQKEKLIFDSTLLTIRVLSMLLAFLVWNEFYSTLLALAISSSIVYTCSYFYLFRAVGVDACSILSLFFKKILILSPLMFGLVYLRYFSQGEGLTLFIGVGTTLIVQGFIVFVFDAPVKLVNKGKFKNVLWKKRNL